MGIGSDGEEMKIGMRGGDGSDDKYLAFKLYLLFVVVGSVPFRKAGFTSKRREGMRLADAWDCERNYAHGMGAGELTVYSVLG